ncbi:MarC family NAAT transporter [Xanthomarina sp. F1114]|uniref:MarC family NAAT transporter n=1 Tax=Xanthomarina sp. F1114 TaxID=2996019 RepID=UPI00225E6165|nr:MarC family NAAT transporter [Xanthomarina sp. F1114]MCX7549010.1 MarC family NAAT transporter [Xanthomarina sp. F1114]
MELLLTTLAALISVMNPLGTVPVFVGLTKEHIVRDRNRTAFWTSFNVFIILIISFFLGKFMLVFFGITLNSLKIAGGLIITLSGFSLLSGEFAKHKGMKKEKVKKDIKTRSDISLTPLALPMIAGPGTISLLITYNQEYPEMENVLIILGAIVCSALIIFFTLRSSFLIVKLLGASGINALSRIIGFIVISIGVEFIVSASKTIYNI